MKRVIQVLLVVMCVVSIGVIYKLVKKNPTLFVEATPSNPPKISEEVPAESDFLVKDFGVKPESLKDKEVVIYVTPHADDETLTYGVPILNDLHAGKEVFVMLSSHGDSTGAFVPINKKIKPQLTRRQLGQARVAEFQEATKRLGIPKERTVVYDLLITPKDREKDREKLKKILTHYATQFPKAEFKGMSKYDVSVDHNLIGEVLEELKVDNKISSVTFFASLNLMYTCHTVPSCADKQAKIGKPTPIESLKLMNNQDKEKIIAAAEAYNIWDPKNGWYAIGNHSVPSQFIQLKDKLTTVIVQK